MLRLPQALVPHPHPYVTQLQGPMQHLYGRLAAILRPGVDDAQILQALHPTPAVCGRPREAAFSWLAEKELFDRGFYSGPFGWLSGAGAEWAVAIRSALIEPHTRDDVAALLGQPPRHCISLYAGVGVVAGSAATAEWAELELKTRPLRSLLQLQVELLC
jgi:isochorismate synthase EntC